MIFIKASMIFIKSPQLLLNLCSLVAVYWGWCGTFLMLWRHWFWVKSDRACAHVPSRTMTAALLPSLPTGIGGSVVMSTAKEKRCLKWHTHSTTPFSTHPPPPPPISPPPLFRSVLLFCRFFPFCSHFSSIPASDNIHSHLPSWPGNRTRLSGDSNASLRTLNLLQHHQNTQKWQTVSTHYLPHTCHGKQADNLYRKSNNLL